MSNPKRPRDANQLAKSIVDLATEADRDTSPPQSSLQRRAQKGGLSGGNARAKTLTPERRQEIAKAAAIKRWGKEDDGNGD